MSSSDFEQLLGQPVEVARLVWMLQQQMFHQNRLECFAFAEKQSTAVNVFLGGKDVFLLPPDFFLKRRTASPLATSRRVTPGAGRKP